MLNPEYGAHPITTDPGELAAAERASDRSFEEFPYYRWRYGDRGRRFGASDGAWLVTLCSSPSKIARQQIDWLGVVLSSRGMPRLLLEAHLRFLFDELGGGRRYRVLNAAADIIAATYDRSPIDRLGREFVAAAPRPWRERIPEMGRLLAAAVADERSGIERAVVSIEEWACDRERFPPAWIKTVRSTIAAARRR
jgi:hypothetical protein